MNRNLPDELTAHAAFGPAVPSTASPDWINTAKVMDVEVYVQVLNGVSPTGSAVTLSQATSSSGASAKALTLPFYYANTDPTNTSIATRVNAASNTFTPVNTTNAQLVYRIPVDTSAMDKANSFTFMRVGLANAVNSTISATYIVRPFYGGNAAANPNVAT
jgi:hypothetical protein